MMEMKEQTGSRKKYLAPVVVLMLCLVTLTGAAYAYSSTMTYEDNTLTSDILSLDLATGVIASDVVTGDDAEAIVVFTDDFTYTGGDKSNVIKYETADGITGKYYIMITGDAAFNSFKVNSDNIGNVLPFEHSTVPAVASLKLSDLYTFSYIVKDETDTNVVITETALGTAVTGNTMTLEADTIYCVNILATAKDIAQKSGTVATSADASVTAEDFKDDVGDLGFTLTFEAKKIDA